MGKRSMNSVRSRSSRGGSMSCPSGSPSVASTMGATSSKEIAAACSSGTTGGPASATSPWVRCQRPGCPVTSGGT